MQVVVVSDVLQQAIGRGSYLRHGGKKFRVTAAGDRALQVLRELSSSTDCQTLAGLLQMRQRIRRVVNTAPPFALACVIDTCREVNPLRLAIWICGRARVHLATKSIARNAYHEDFRVRREAIRSLSRLAAWVELRKIAIDGIDQRTRELAGAANLERKAYTTRLASFLAMTKSPTMTLYRHHLVISPGTEIGAGKPPRSGWQIRRVLERIRILAKGCNRRSAGQHASVCGV